MNQGWEGSEADDAIVGLKNSSAIGCMLAAGNAYLEIFEYQNPKPKPQDPKRPVCDVGITHFCLDVIDIDGEYLPIQLAL